MTLDLRFAGPESETRGRFDPKPFCTLHVKGIPDGTDPRGAEAVARHCVDRGLAVPVNFTLSWSELVRIGLEAGELRMVGGMLAVVPWEP